MKTIEMVEKDPTHPTIQGNTETGPPITVDADEIRVTIPTVSEFGDLDYLLAQDLKRIAAEHINTYEEFSHLPNCQILYVWKKTGGTTHGNIILGRCQTVPALAKFLFCVEGQWDLLQQTDDPEEPHDDPVPPSFLISLSADHLYGSGSHAGLVSARFIQALMYHELSHIDQNPHTGNFCLRTHDFEGFGLEIKRFGASRQGLLIAEKAFRQGNLFE